MVVQQKFYTAEDLWKLSQRPENETRRFELSEGKLVEMSPAGGKHGGVAGDLLGYIWNHVRQHNLGYVTAAETGYILFKNPGGKDTVRAPDVGFVALERLPDGLPNGYIPFAPDLAVEVVSPGDDADEIQFKVKQYLRAGTRLVLVAYPKSQNVMLHTPAGVKRIETDGIIDFGEMLPGLTVPVRAIFAKE